MTTHDVDLMRVSGSGGGGKGKGGGKDADNTLRSKARARMVEVISEGEIEGLVNGARSIYFEQTPIENSDGSINFKNVIWQEHKGLPDEDHFQGMDTVETPEQVEVEVKKNTGAVTRTIVDPNADAVRIVMRIPALFKQDKDTGAMKATDVSYKIWVRPYQGVWAEALTNNLRKEKCTSPVQIAHVVDLPLNGSPWDIRIERLTNDSEDVKLQNETWWEGYVILVRGKFTYPNTAAVALEVNAEDMGSSIPARSFHVRGIKCQVPTNYDPVTRTYTGLWDGTFKKAWTSNPAWIFYDLVTNDRYGLGEFVDSAKIDKWSLYTVGQYCDQEIKSGYKNGSTGADIYEPRFSFNGVINSREEAYHVLQKISTAWRGMAFWSIGQVFATADMPADPIRIVTPANVINGEFNYSGTAMKARHSVVVVRWNDPDDFYRPSTEVVIDNEMLKRYGWREKSLQLEGCTSRGLAHRYGKWVLDVERNETETVEYQASWDHAELRPGDIIAISDPAKAQVRAGGRVRNYDAATATVTLDHPFEPTGGATYSLMVTLPDGKLETRPIASFAGAVVTLGEGYSVAPVPDAMFAVTGTDITPRTFRILAVAEEEPNIFKVTALVHDPDKYERVEKDIVFAPKPYSRPQNIILPPRNLSVTETSYVEQGVTVSKLLLGFTPDDNFPSRAFKVRVETPDDGILDFGEVSRPWFEMNSHGAGDYVFHVRAISYTGLVSTEASFAYTAIGAGGILAPTVTNIKLTDRPTSGEFVGRDVSITWQNNFASASDPTVTDGAASSDVNPLYLNNTVRVYDNVTSTLLRTENVTSALFVYSYDMNVADSAAAALGSPRRSLRFEVSVTDKLGRTSPVTSAIFTNPVPAPVMPSFEVNANTVHFTFPRSSDEDFAGYLIWRSTDNGFDPLLSDNFVESAGNIVSMMGAPGQTYYYRFAAFDAFGKEGLSISAQVAIENGSIELDTTPPAVPTGLALTSALVDGAPMLTATWNANTEDDLLGYDVEIRQGAGNFVGFSTSTNLYEWAVRSGASYTVRVRARDKVGNPSAWSATQTIAGAADTVAPATPSGLVAQALFRSVWLKWAANTEADLSHYLVEVSNGTTTTTFLASANEYVAQGLALGLEHDFRIRAVDTSGNLSAWTSVVFGTPGAVNAGELHPDAVVSSFALIDDAFIESAQIVELDAAKIKAGSVISGSVLVSTSGGEMPIEDLGASGDPAETINAGSTLIEPGKIRISGTTSLADWRKGGDATNIDGGKISANTIEANSAVFGLRGLTIDGIEFEHNSPAPNEVAWTGGTIRYLGDDGNIASHTIAAGSTAWTAGTVYLTYIKGQTVITATTDAAVAFQSDRVILATYRGGRDLVGSYGRTVIDGAAIKTGSVTADKLQVTSLEAMNATIGTIQSAPSGARTVISDSLIQVFDSSDVLRVRLGVW